MKRFIWLLILAAAGYGVWRYYPELERQARSRTAEAPPEAAVADGANAIPDRLPGTSATRAAVAAPPAVAVTAPDEQALADRFPLPEFQPIEALVGGWKKLPASAFPRQITLKVPATLQLTGGVGTSTLPAGRKVVALSGTPEGALVIAPSQDAVMRGTVPMEATDFQAVLSSVYEDFKTRKRAEVARLRAAARIQSAAAKSSATFSSSDQDVPPSAAAMAKIGPRPTQNDDLTVAAVTASIAERQRSRKHTEPPADAVLDLGTG